LNEECDTVTFVAVLRADDNAPDPGRGLGAWRLTLPFPIAQSFYDADSSHALRIGDATIGGGEEFPDHEMKTGLHAHAIPNGYAERTSAVIVRQGGMWAGHDWPWPDHRIANIHWQGVYEVDPEEIQEALQNGASA
jgi:hypothetical protein